MLPRVPQRARAAARQLAMVHHPGGGAVGRLLLVAAQLALARALSRRLPGVVTRVPCKVFLGRVYIIHARHFDQPHALSVLYSFFPCAWHGMMHTAVCKTR